MDRDPDSVEAEEILDLRCKVLTFMPITLLAGIWDYKDGYDSRFEPYSARGYEAGWRANR